MILAIVQARTGATRLPGKVLRRVLGRPLLFYLLQRLKKAKLIDKIVVATTTKKRDELIVDFCEKQKTTYFRGSEEDVLDRFYQAAKKYQAEVIVRITADCPLIDPQIIDKVIKKFKSRDFDYVSNTHPATYPDGMDTEVFSFQVLERVWQEAKKPSEREHVTPYIWKNPGKFRLGCVRNPEDLSKIRLTVDYQEDFLLVKEVIEAFYRNDKSFTLKEILNFLKKQRQVIRQENKFFKTNQALKKAKKLIPSAAQTYSKSYKYFCEGMAPAFLAYGKGGYVWDVDGNCYLDFVLGLGAITLGYRNSAVDKAIEQQLKKGISFSQSTLLEIKLAQKLTKIIPCCQMVRFVKNGSDATAAAVRLARAYTKREIVACCGYHGYQDWYIGSTENDRGVPKVVKKLTKTFKYNNLNSLKKIFNKNRNKVAAVILEPCQGNGPKNNFLKKVKALTRQHGAVLIFDETISGFRLGFAGAQGYYKVTPDLSAFGKGMGNGLPLSVVCGKSTIMRLIDKGAFISTTFGGEALSLAGVLATIKVLERPNSFKYIFQLGERWKEGVKRLIKEKNLEGVVTVVGLAPHCGVAFSKKGRLSEHDLFSVFQQELIKEGILTTGINNFCLAHKKSDIDKYIKAADLAFDKVKEVIKKKNLKGVLLGGKFRPIFRRN